MLNEKDCQLLIFDWGDTLMRVFPQYAGAMVDWPEVEVTPGAIEGLSGLAGSYRLVVGTNSSDSSPAQVRQALDRAGLGQFFDLVFTAHETESRKPDAAFFNAISQQTNVAERHMVMVGDDFTIDIAGAHRAGLRTIWLNPKNLESPSSMPVQDAEIRSLAELPELMAGAWLPAVDMCESWLLENGAGESLLAHVRQVAQCAYRMAVWLRQRGGTVNPVLAHRGGLLHDLDKLSAQTRHGTHGELADRILMDKGQPALAAIARRHVMHKIREQDAPSTWEEKLVYYADKLVEGDQIVSWQVRMKALRLRYPEYVHSFELSEPHLAALEGAIYQALELTPQELSRHLRTRNNT